MPRRNNDAILILSPSRIELARCAPANRSRVETMAFEQGVWSDAMASDYKPFDHWLGRAAASLRLPAKARITIYLTGTSLRTEISQHAGAERIVSGIAHATMAEQFESQEGIYHVCVARLAGRPEPGTNAHRYFIMAELDSVLDGMTSFVERAGFMCSGISSVALTHAGSVCKALSSAEKPRLVCDVGEHVSIVAMGDENAIPLFRPFNVGVAAFNDVYNRVLEQANVENAGQIAREFVFRHGVPNRDDPIGESLKLTGRDVLPMLQPVIQRLAVEIKNTIRFGLEGQDLEDQRVELTGLAARIPGLAAALAANLDFDIVARAENGEGDEQEAITTIAGMLDATGIQTPKLRPIRLGRQIAKRRVNWALRFGGHIAAGILLAEFMVTYADTRGLAAELRSLGPRLAAVREFGEQSGRASVLASELGAIRSVIDERVGSVAQWAPALNAIAGVMQENTRLTDCRGFHESGHAWYRLRGEAVLESAKDRTLGVLLDALERNDMIDLVELESARIENIAGGSIQRFVIRVRLVSRPAAPEAVVLTSAGDPTPRQEGGPP